MHYIHLSFLFFSVAILASQPIIQKKESPPYHQSSNPQEKSTQEVSLHNKSRRGAFDYIYKDLTPALINTISLKSQQQAYAASL